MTTDNRRADILTQWLAAASAPDRELSRVDRSVPVEASPAQLGLWLAQEIQGGATGFATQHSYRMSGPLDAEALSRALDRLVERHEILRTGFYVDGHLVRQDVRPPYSLELRPEPVPATTGVPEQDLRSALAETARDGLDLTSGRVMRARLFNVADDEHILVLIIHHIALDGWSVSVLQRDLAALYAGEAIEPMSLQYLDFAEWQRREVADGRYADGVRFWRDALAGVPQPMPLPTDRPRRPTQSFRGDCLRAPLPSEAVRRVDTLAGEAGATPHIVTLAVFVSVLARWTGCGDLVVGTAVNHRPLPETDDMIGPFASILPVRYTVRDGLTFREHLEEVKQQVLDAREHEDVPFELILDSAGVTHSPAYNPLVQVTMTYKSGVIEPVTMPGLTVAEIPAQDIDVQRDLALEVTGERGDQLSVAYASDLWDRATVEALAAAYAAALDHATRHPDEPLGSVGLPLPLTSPE
ncbi:condensation domain-containing protein [Streptomyces sp. NPDC096323]|uniref:condensation domain-containing protein n=1 Tax=Streptomyces sp. NPDC096323 TaxID=3155822 RepID=UPI00331C549D